MSLKKMLDEAQRPYIFADAWNLSISALGAKTSGLGAGHAALLDTSGQGAHQAAGFRAQKTLDQVLRSRRNMQGLSGLTVGLRRLVPKASLSIASPIPVTATIA